MNPAPGVYWKKLFTTTLSGELSDHLGACMQRKATIRKTTVSRRVDHNMLCLMCRCTQGDTSMQRICRNRGCLCIIWLEQSSSSGRLASDYMCEAEPPRNAPESIRNAAAAQPQGATQPQCATRQPGSATRGWRGSIVTPGVRIVPRSHGIAQRYIYTSPPRVSHPPGLIFHRRLPWKTETLSRDYTISNCLFITTCRSKYITTV